jgi:hypothetical protein
MHDDFGNLSISSAVDDSPDPFQKVYATTPKSQSPSLIPNAMIPEIGAVKGTIRLCGVADKASRRMSIQRQNKNEGEMMSIPKRFECLLSQWCMRCSVHQEHAEQHDMSGNSTCLGIMYLESRYWSRTDRFDVLN